MSAHEDVVLQATIRETAEYLAGIVAEAGGPPLLVTFYEPFLDTFGYATSELFTRRILTADAKEIAAVIKSYFQPRGGYPGKVYRKALRAGAREVH